MRHSLLVCALVAASIVTGSGRVDAGTIPAAGLGSIAPPHADMQRVHWRGYWHCHGPRWDARCHGARRYWGYPSRMALSASLATPPLALRCIQQKRA